MVLKEAGSKYSNGLSYKAKEKYVKAKGKFAKAIEKSENSFLGIVKVWLCGYLGQACGHKYLDLCHGLSGCGRH